MLAEQKATFIIVSRLDNQVITSFVSHGLLFSSYKCFWGSLQVFCNQETNEWNEFVQKFEMLISYFVFFFVKQSKHQDSRKIGKKIEICFFVKWNFFQRFCHLQGVYITHRKAAARMSATKIITPKPLKKEYRVCRYVYKINILIYTRC